MKDRLKYRFTDFAIPVKGMLNYIDAVILKYCLDNNAVLKSFDKNLISEYETVR